MTVLKAADLFCGAGGASTGLMRACAQLGVGVDLLAVNHWPIAVQTHQLNHPNVKHLCEAVDRIDPREVVPGGRLHLLLAGPECTHFSTARGGRPVNAQSRASAWHILKWAQELYIDTILIENVPEFRTWGPIGANNKPLKSKKGQTYAAFLVALRSLGYSVEDRILNAADYGDPTTRRRLFIIARRGRHKVSWPAPSHSKTGNPTLFGTTKRWKAAREVIDWSVPGKSIFNRKKPLKPATIARILAGLEKFGGPDLKPFLVVLRRHMAGQSVDGPLPTLTAGGGHVGIAQPFLVAMEHGGRLLDADQPLPTITTAKGGAFGVAQPFLLHTTHGGRVGNVAEPFPTVTGARRGELAVVEPFVISAGGAKLRSARGTSEPLPTVMGSDRLAVVDAFVLGQQSGSMPRSVRDPLPTIATDGAISVVEPYLTKYNRTATGAYSVNDPVDTISTRDRFALVEPFLLDAAHGSDGTNDNCRAHSLDGPLGVVTGSNRFALIQPVIDGYMLDIRFRMLQPHELAAATSFPKSYKFQGNREDVVKQIGNAWPGELAKALCLQIARDYAPKQQRRRDVA